MTANSGGTVRIRNHKALLAIQRDPRVQERFWSHVAKSDAANGCWEWRGSVKPGGYPSMQVGNNSITPRVLSWYWSMGELPVSGRFGQVCGNQLCVRPSHLAWVVGRMTEQRLVAESDGYLQIAGVEVSVDNPLPCTPRVRRHVTNARELEQVLGENFQRRFGKPAA
jgi:hypothetical protein